MADATILRFDNVSFEYGHNKPILVRKASNSDHNKIDKHPEAETSKCDEHQDASADLSYVETVYAKYTYKKAKNKRNQTGLLRCMLCHITA